MGRLLIDMAKRNKRRKREARERAFIGSEGPDESSIGTEGPSESPRQIYLKDTLTAYKSARRHRERALYGESKYVGPSTDDVVIGANKDLAFESEKSDDAVHFIRTAGVLSDLKTSPLAYVRRRFDVSPLKVVYPNALLSFGGLKDEDLVRSLMRSPAFRDSLRFSLTTQRAVARTALALVDDPRLVLLDTTLELTPLFRYLLASMYEDQETAAAMLTGARLQYVPASDDYDEAWGSFIPREAAEELRGG